MLTRTELMKSEDLDRGLRIQQNMEILVIKIL